MTLVISSPCGEKLSMSGGEIMTSNDQNASDEFIADMGQEL